MSEDEFETELRALIDRAREGRTIPLMRMADIVAAEGAGLEMAAEEGETW
jgi:hypothetical protein